MNIRPFCDSDQIFVPVDLCQYAISSKNIPEFRIFLYLHLIEAPVIQLSNNNLNALKGQLGYKDLPHMKRLLEDLKNLGWVKIDRFTNCMRLLSFEDLHKKAGYYKEASVIAYPNNLDSFPAFLFAAVAGYFHRGTNRSRQERLRRSQNSGLLQAPEGYSAISSKVLSKCLNHSIGTISAWKRAAVAHGYIEIKKNVLKLPTSGAKNTDNRINGMLDCVAASKVRKFVRGPDYFKINLRYLF